MCIPSIVSSPGSLSPPCMYDFEHMTFEPLLKNRRGKPDRFYHVNDIEGREKLESVAKGVTMELIPRAHLHNNI